MTRKVFNIIVATALGCTLECAAQLPKALLPGKSEAVMMLNEADDFIDSMAEGLQDRQADAVLHAMRGEGNQLLSLRRSRNSCAPISENVDTVSLTGDGNARGLAMRLYRPKVHTGTPLPLLVYYHGGGWTIGSINSCSAFCNALATTGKVAVLAVEYSLAPEQPSPKGLYDCMAAAEYARAHAAELGSAPEFVSLGGDSSGGNLALAAALGLRRDNTMLQPVRSLVLFYPVTEAVNDKSDSWRKYSRGYGLDGRLMEAFISAYLGGRSASPAESPSASPEDALAKLPPVLMVSAERDILFDQGTRLHEHLGRLGVKSERVIMPGAVHLFITVSGQPTAFAKAVELTAAFLK